MIYSTEVQNMCPVPKGAYHGPAPIPEEGKWVQAKEIKDISGLTHGVGWCAPQQGACKLTLNVKDGIIEEALMFASAKHVDNLIVTVDNNGKQIDGPTDQVCSLGKLRSKFEAFGWIVLEMDGNDIKKCVQTLNLAKSLAGNQKPVAIIMKTEMGMGVDFMMGTHKWHGSAPNDEQAEAALAQLPVTLGDY